MKIPRKLRIIWEVVSSCADGLMAYIGSYFVLSWWLNSTPQVIDFAGSYLGPIGELIVACLPFWLSIPVPIVVAGELAIYRIQKLRMREVQETG